MTDRQARRRLPRQQVPARDPEERSHDFAEVMLGFPEALARLEAERCLRCPRPKCVDGCPVGVRIDEFIGLVAEGRFDEAAGVIDRDNSLPAICGRVCPQETQCEGACVVGRKSDPIAIGALERFVADRRRLGGLHHAERPSHRSGHRIAVVGSGPAGLACAGDLAKMGHDVTVFEALHEPGGVLVYGIPEFRLPKDIVRAEVAQLERLGVRFELNAVIGMAETLDELLSEYDSVFVGVGAGLPRFLEIPGENLVGVFSANEFLTRVNLMRGYLEQSETPVFDIAGRHVAVFGGGNTAMDAARTALRLGADPVSIVYRRTEAEMPARREEIHHAKEEGIRFSTLTAPVEFVGDDDCQLIGAVMRRMELGEPDDSGRRRPRPIPGSEHPVVMHAAVIAIGNQPNPLLPSTDHELEQTARGTLIADPDTGRTTKRGVFAGGDIVTGGATVILAMGAGRRAAAAIDVYVRTGVWSGEIAPAVV